MGKASSSKKVQRAARAAANSRGAGETRERGFPLLVLAIVVLGVGLVLAARSSRDEAVAPLRTDHWHSAYEVYDCGTLRPSLQTQTDPDGIHTHADGLIHIHPFNSSATGEDARFDVFLDASGLVIEDDLIEARGAFDAGYEPIDLSTGCDGEDSEIVITRWNVIGADQVEMETTYRGDYADIPFLHENEAFTIAKVPVGEDAPEPSASVLAQLAVTTGTTNLASENLPLTPDDLADGDETDGTEGDDAEGDDAETDGGETDTDADDTESGTESTTTTEAPADDTDG